MFCWTMPGWPFKQSPAVSLFDRCNDNDTSTNVREGLHALAALLMSRAISIGSTRKDQCNDGSTYLSRFSPDTFLHNCQVLAVTGQR
jgi:hypothetical protein